MNENKNTISEEEEETKDLKTLFDMYARFGDPESEGTITLKNIDKWLKQAEILDQTDGVTDADTAITFVKIVRDKKRMDMNEFQEFIETLAFNKKAEPEEFLDKLVAAGEPKLSIVTPPVTLGAAGINLRRLTDPKLNTGVHEEHLDEEDKGKEDGMDTQSDKEKDETDSRLHKEHLNEEDKGKEDGMDTQSDQENDETDSRVHNEHLDEEDKGKEAGMDAQSDKEKDETDQKDEKDKKDKKKEKR